MPSPQATLTRMPTPADELLHWFRATRRDLSWRTPYPRDPYAVLVAEVMAQQTQIDRVVPAHARFMGRFPSLEALAAANEDEAVAGFSGLGYYRRARSLHRAVREIAARGAWPTAVADLRRLPGVGTYTAAAVSAFCFGGHEPPVDGNVERVTARLQGLSLPLGSPRLLNASAVHAAALFADVKTPEVWEALMELGATVCTPASPRCDACPLARRCTARATDSVRRHPLPKPTRRPERQRWVVVWLERPGHQVLLRRTEDGGVLAGMWLPPFRRLRGGEDEAVVARQLAADAAVRIDLARGSAITHSITHRRIVIVPFAGRADAAAVALPRDGWRWDDWRAPSLPTSSLLGKLATACSGVRPGKGPVERWSPAER
jgi:A/G-specific adenine glycosylase